MWQQTLQHSISSFLFFLHAVKMPARASNAISNLAFIIDLVFRCLYIDLREHVYKRYKFAILNFCKFEACYSSN